MSVINNAYFVPNMDGKAPKIISEYDNRADVENLVDEAKREGLAAIPSTKFKTIYAYFQIVRLAYNILHYLKIIDQLSIDDNQCDLANYSANEQQGTTNNTIRIARRKLLFTQLKL